MLASKSVSTGADSSNLVHLVDPNELPVGGKISFVLKTIAAARLLAERQGGSGVRRSDAPHHA